MQLGRQLQQGEVMGDGGLVDAHAPGDRCVRVAGIDSAPDESRQVQRRETMALLVLGDLGVGIGRRVANDHRDFNQPRTLSRTPTLCAEVNAVPTLLVSRMNDDGLKNAVLADVFGEFVQLGFGELGAWVVRVFAQQADGQHERCTVLRGRHLGYLCFVLRRGHVRRDIRSKQVELSWLGLDPRREAHARIVPRRIKRWKCAAVCGSSSRQIARGLARAHSVSERLGAIDEAFQLRACARRGYAAPSVRRSIA